MTDSIASLPRLPRHPSTLIRLACDDAEKIYRTPGYKLNMNLWHEPADGACCVCFAGAVIAGTLGAAKGRYVPPEAFGARDCAALRALNLFRGGGWVEGLSYLIDRDTTPEEQRKLLDAGLFKINIPRPKAGTKGVAFIRAMRMAAKALESVGW